MAERADPAATLAAAEEAVSAARWSEALGLLDDDPLASADPAGLALRGQAAYGAGDPEASIGAWEALYRLRLGTGDPDAAARAAAMVAMYLMIDTGLMSPIRGWLRRAERLIDDRPESPVDAVIAMVRTYERLWCGDMAAAGANAGLAMALGRRHGFAPAVIIGTVASGRLRIFEGQVADGLELLDDVAVSLASGEVDAMTTGMAYCELICAAQGLAEYDRAGEWTQAMDHWRQGSVLGGFGGFGGRCRVHRAEMLRLTGPCDEAEREVLEACEELRPWMRREFGWPLTELGNIRFRTGDWDGAEEAFLAAHRNSWMPQPGLALLRLVRGDTGAAVSLIADALDHPFDVPSKERPPHGGLRRAPLLEAQVEISVAANDLVTARRAADELTTIATTFPSRAIAAGAALARARVGLADGDARAAIIDGERALVAWIELGAPFEAAVVRMTLGRAHLLAGHEEAARMEWEAARGAFLEFGATPWAHRAAQEPRAALGDAPRRPGPSVASTGVFRCEGEIRTVTFDGRTALIRDLVGLRYIARLLAEPHREFHAVDLVAVERGTLPLTSPSGDAAALPGRDGGAAGFHLDDQAREAYRRRLVDIDEDIAEATAMHDLGRIALARADREFLVNELARAVGLGGRRRTMLSTSERARTSVTRSIRYSVARVAEHHPGLGEHLRQAISTGTYCAYLPDPRLRTDWET